MRAARIRLRARLKPLILRDQDTRRPRPLICSLLGTTIPQSRIRAAPGYVPLARTQRFSVRHARGAFSVSPSPLPPLSRTPCIPSSCVTVLREQAGIYVNTNRYRYKRPSKVERATCERESGTRWRGNAVRLAIGGRFVRAAYEGGEEGGADLAFIKMQTADHLNTYSR
jgi:hypothetical protein